MDKGRWLTEEIERLRLLNAAGDPSAIHSVALHCIWNKLTIPDWAVDLVESMIQRDLVSRTRRGKGNPTPAAKSIKFRRDAAWFDGVNFIVERDKISREKAYVRFQELLPVSITKKALKGTYERELKRRQQSMADNLGPDST